LIVSYLVFDILPLQHQLIGGIITVAGVLVMALAQAGFVKIPFSNARNRHTEK
jgi:hypothetical protein